MIGIDTNVLLRYVLQDDGRQSPLASAFLTGEDRLDAPALLNAVVLIEFVWTLRSRERLGKAAILALLDALCASPRIAFADGAAIRSAVEDWRTGPADLADYLIGALNRSAGATTTLTFDTDASAHADFTLLREDGADP